jgi:hypothetical protein
LTAVPLFDSLHRTTAAFYFLTGTELIFLFISY